jgi:hypothetical protein
VRAGLVDDPPAYPWSSCAAYALGTPNRLISLHPSYLALCPYAKVRQRHYRALLAPSEDPRTDAWDPPCWTSQRAVGAEEGQSKAATLVALRFVETSLLRRRPHT